MNTAMEVSDGNLRVHQIHSEIVSDATAEILEANPAHTADPWWGTHPAIHRRHNVDSLAGSKGRRNAIRGGNAGCQSPLTPHIEGTRGHIPQSTGVVLKTYQLNP